MALRSYDQPEKDTTKIFISSPRIYAAEYNAGSPATFNGHGLVSVETAPTSGDWVDAGVIEGVTITVDKTFAKSELGLPKTVRKMVEIKRDSKIAFNLKELPVESLALLFGLRAKNIVVGTVATIGGTPTRTSVTLGAGEGVNFIAGDRVATSTTEAGCITSNNRAKVYSVVGDVLTLVGSGFPTAPTAADKLKKYYSVELVDMMSTISERSILMWFDYLDNNVPCQIAMWFPRMTAGKAFSPDLKGGENFADAAVELESLATTQTLTDGTSALVHSVAYFFD